MDVWPTVKLIPWIWSKTEVPSGKTRLKSLSSNTWLNHYSAGEIYYLDRKQLDSVLGGAAPQKIGLVPDVLFE